MVVLFFFFFLSRTASTINIDGRCMGLHEFPTLYVANIFSTDITPPLLLSASSLLCHTRCVHYTRAGHRWCARRPRLCFLGLSILFLFHQRRSVALGWNVRRLERIGARAWSGVDGVLFSISSYCNFLGFFFFFLFHQLRFRGHREYSRVRTNCYSGVDDVLFHRYLRLVAIFQVFFYTFFISPETMSCSLRIFARSNELVFGCWHDVLFFFQYLRRIAIFQVLNIFFYFTRDDVAFTTNIRTFERSVTRGWSGLSGVDDVRFSISSYGNFLGFFF